MKNLETLLEQTALVLPANGLEQKLKHAESENRKLIIKLGFDPTAPDLHLGHAVVLRKIKQFQDLGHQIIIIVGSFTAQIGDPTGKNKSRKPLSKLEVHANAETYIRQLSKVIDVGRCLIKFNADWLDQLQFSDLLQVLSRVTVAQLLHRNDFNKRFIENAPISMHELMYPIMQAYDSLHIKADIEMGGVDQMFNCTMGRQLQESYGEDPQVVVCMPLLRGLDGKEKMSKSLNNTIGLTDEPRDMFGKVMSIPDDLIHEFLNLATDFNKEEKDQLLQQIRSGENPMQIKKMIAKNVIKQYHSMAAADEAEAFFTSQFQSRSIDDKSFTTVPLDTLVNQGTELSIVTLCHELKRDETKSSLRRLILSGAVQVNSSKITDPNAMVCLEAGIKVRIGKRSYYQLV